MTPPSKEQLNQLIEQMQSVYGLLSSARDQLESAHNTVQTMVSVYDDPPPPVVQPRKLRLAVHDYDGTTPIDYDTYDVYDLQRGMWWDPTRFRADQERYIYTTFVRRPGDELGLTQFMRPSYVPDSQIMHYRSTGALVWRSRSGGEHLVNFSHPQWVEKAIESITSAALYYRSNVYLDEVDKTPTWAWGTNEFAEIYGDAAWQDHMLVFVRGLAEVLHANGLKLWINLGADYDVAEPWQQGLLEVVDGVNIEFFIAREGVGQSLASAGNGWERGVSFVAAAEGGGVDVHVHASSNAQIDYPFLSWLLATEFRGSFSAGLEHNGQKVLPTASLLASARQLGLPLYGMVQSESGQYERGFENGIVQVNPYTTWKGDLAPRTGRIVLR